MGDSGAPRRRPGTGDSVGAEQLRRRFAGHEPSQGTDTGGTPWQGRQLTSTGFDGDAGAADPELLEALRATAAADPADPSGAETQLVERVASARLLVPVVAVAGETTEVNGLESDATSDMAAVTLVSPDGQRALPAFTSLRSLAAWDGTARPVPVTAQRAAQAAIQEGCHTIVLDVGSPITGLLRGSMVWALAMGRPWVPAHRDPQVRRGVEAAAAREPDVVRVSLAGGPGGALRLDLALRPGLSPADLQLLTQRVGERIALDGEVRARIDALAFSVSGA